MTAKITLNTRLITYLPHFAHLFAALKRICLDVCVCVNTLVCVCVCVLVMRVPNINSKIMGFYVALRDKLPYLFAGKQKQQ